jgi:hypothetical protein
MGDQLFRCGLATAKPQTFTMASSSEIPSDFGVVPHDDAL